MDRQQLIDKVIECRQFADEILAEVQSEHWEVVYRAERVLDAVDFLLAYLNRENERGSVL